MAHDCKRIALFFVLLMTSCPAFCEGFLSPSWYLSVDMIAQWVNTTFPCKGFACAPGETVYDSSGVEPNIGMTAGLRLNKYLAIQVTTEIPGESTSKDGLANNSIVQVTNNDAWESHVSLRADLPLWHRWRVFATYGYGWRSVRFETEEKKPERDFSENASQSQTYYANVGGSYRPFSFGISGPLYHSSPSSLQAFRIEYMPPIGGASNFGLRKLIFAIEW